MARCLIHSNVTLTVVQDFFVAQDTTAFHLLFQTMDTYTGVQQLQANNNLNGMNEAASICEFAHAASLQFHGKRQTRPAVETMSILQAQLIKKFSCNCRLHTMMFWLIGGNHKKDSRPTPGCHCSTK